MARYSLGFTKSGVTVAGAIADLDASATDRAHLLEMGIFCTAATGTTPVCVVGLSRLTAVGTRTSPVTVLSEEVAEGAGTATVATAWSVAPTIAANPLRRITFNAVGQGVIWTWPDRTLSVALSAAIALHAVSVAGTTPSFTFDGYFVVDE